MAFIERRNTSFVVRVRSGVSNSAVWFFIELWLGYLIDRLLSFLYNRCAVRTLARGHEMELRESRIPLFGNGLFANHGLSGPIILVRIAVAIAFLVMNLGIDGIEEPKFQPVYLHSKVAVDSDGCNNRRTSFIGWTLSKCTRHSDDRQAFNVSLPVFNLSRIDDEPNKYLVNQSTMHCMDGKEMKEDNVLVKGRWLRSLLFRQDIGLQGRLYLEAENSTFGFQVGPQEPSYFLGSSLLPYGKVYKLSRVIRLTTGKVLSDGKLTAYCSPRTTVNITTEAGEYFPRIGQTHLCYFLYKIRSSSYLFNGIIHKLYVHKLGIGAQVRFSDAVVFDKGIDFNSDIFKTIAYDYLLSGDGSHGILTKVLSCHYDGALNGKEKRYEIISGDVKVTNIHVISFTIGCAVVVFAVLLSIFFVSTFICGGRNPEYTQVEVNSLDGLSRFLSNNPPSTRGGKNTSNNRARVRFSDTIQVISAGYKWSSQSSMDLRHSTDSNWSDQLRKDLPHSP